MVSSKPGFLSAVKLTAIIYLFHYFTGVVIYNISLRPHTCNVFLEDLLFSYK